MADKKTSIFAILDILTRDSDENHLLKEPEIRKKVEMIYHIHIDRRTLYSNINMLKEYGYDIETYADNGKGYFLRERQFEPSEVFLLCNAIHSSNLIPNKSSKDLINNLLKTQSKYYAENYNNLVYVENKNKKDNKEFFLNIELLSEAITEKSCVSFNYTTYDVNKKLVNRRDELYRICPYYLIYADEKTFLIGKSLNHPDNGLIHFRVDKIKNLKKTDDPYIRKTKTEDPYEYAKNKVYMYHGDELKISIKCDNSILDDIIDRFGKDITIEALDKKHFKAYIKSTKQGMIYFALQYINHMEVIEPKSLRKEIKSALEDGVKKYK